MKNLVVIFFLLSSGCTARSDYREDFNDKTHTSDALYKISQDDIKDRIEADRFERLLLNKKTQ